MAEEPIPQFQFEVEYEGKTYLIETDQENPDPAALEQALVADLPRHQPIEDARTFLRQPTDPQVDVALDEALPRQPDAELDQATAELLTQQEEQPSPALDALFSRLQPDGSVQANTPFQSRSTPETDKHLDEQSQLAARKPLTPRQQALGEVFDELGNERLKGFADAITGGRFSRADRGVARGLLGGAEDMLNSISAVDESIRSREPNLFNFINSMTGKVPELIAQTLRPVSEPAADALEDAATGLREDHLPTFFDKTAEGVGSLMLFYGTGMGTAAVTSKIASVSPRIAALTGATQQAVMEAAAEAGGTYDDLLKLVGPQEAARRANNTFAKNIIVNQAMDFIGLDPTGSGLSRIIKGIAAESVQESIQYDIQRREMWVPRDHPAAAQLRRAGWIEERGRLYVPFSAKDAGEAAAIGGLLGGSASTFSLAFNRANLPDLTPEQAQEQFVNSIPDEKLSDLDGQGPLATSDDPVVTDSPSVPEGQPGPSSPETERTPREGPLVAGDRVAYQGGNGDLIRGTLERDPDTNRDPAGPVPVRTDSGGVAFVPANQLQPESDFDLAPEPDRQENLTPDIPAAPVIPDAPVVPDAPVIPDAPTVPPSDGDAAQADAERSGFGDLEGSTRGLAGIFGGPEASDTTTPPDGAADDIELGSEYEVELFGNPERVRVEAVTEDDGSGDPQMYTLSVLDADGQITESIDVTRDEFQEALQSAPAPSAPERNTEAEQPPVATAGISGETEQGTEPEAEQPAPDERPPDDALDDADAAGQVEDSRPEILDGDITTAAGTGFKSPSALRAALTRANLERSEYAGVSLPDGSVVGRRKKDAVIANDRRRRAAREQEQREREAALPHRDIAPWHILPIAERVEREELRGHTLDEIDTPEGLQIAAERVRGYNQGLIDDIPTDPDQLRPFIRERLDDKIEAAREIAAGGLGAHRSRVQRALAAGEIVPPEVLADFPDLDPDNFTDNDADSSGPAASDTPAADAPTSQPAPTPTGEPEGDPRGRQIARTQAGTQIETEFELVEAADLITSNDDAGNINPDFPQILQPRDRTRAGSQDQIERMAFTLDPELLAESPLASNGAPIVGPDNVVESGNGRVLALRQAYGLALPTSGRYRRYLRENAERLGINPESIDEMQFPVMVRVRTSEFATQEERVRFAQEANESNTQQLSTVEQAQVDAGRLTPQLLVILNPDSSGSLVAASNREFTRSFMGTVVPENERGGLIQSDGSISQSLINRMRNAIFARVYGDPTTLERLAEDPDNNMRNVSNAMVLAAPQIAKLQQSIKAGSAQPIDPAPAIAEAAKQLGTLRDQGVSVEDFLAQGTLIGGKLSPAATRIIRIFDANKRSSARIADSLRAITGVIDDLGDPRQTSLLPSARDVPVEWLENVIDRAIARVQDQSGDQLGLTGQQPPAVPGGESEIADDEDRQLAQDALDDLEETQNNGEFITLPGGDFEILARDGDGTLTIERNIKESSVIDELLEKGAVEFVGQTINGPEDLAVMAQTIRDPRFETFRYIFVDDAGTVKGTTATSSRLPATVKVFIPTREDKVQEFKDEMTGFGATGYWVLHNHPTGRPTPSHPDVTSTRAINEHLPGFLGHVVIDTGHYGLITIDAKGTEKAEVLKLPEGTESAFPSEDSPTISDPQKAFAAGLMALEAKRFEAEGYGVAFYVSDEQPQTEEVPTGEVDTFARPEFSSDLRVRGIQLIPLDILGKLHTAMDALKRGSPEFGSSKIYIHTFNASDEIKSILTSLHEVNTLGDHRIRVLSDHIDHLPNNIIRGGQGETFDLDRFPSPDSSESQFDPFSQDDIQIGDRITFQYKGALRTGEVIEFERPTNGFPVRSSHDNIIYEVTPHQFLSVERLNRNPPEAPSETTPDARTPGTTSGRNAAATIDALRKRFREIRRDPASADDATLGQLGIDLVQARQDLNGRPQDQSRIDDLMEQLDAIEQEREAAAETSPPDTPATDAPADVPKVAQMANAILNHLPEPITNRTLQQLALPIFGGNVATGTIDSRTLFDAQEMAANVMIMMNRDATAPDGTVEDMSVLLESMQTFLGRFPSQTSRTQEQEALQQFSTPHDYAAVAAWAANIASGEIVLEPSSGTGNLASWAATLTPQSNVMTNEIGDTRLDVLRGLGFTPTSEDALHLHAIYTNQGHQRPSTVLMNPPFSAQGPQGRPGGNRGRRGGLTKAEALTGAAHMEEGLKLLQDGGRLVAIVGRGMSMEAATFQKFWRKIAKQYNIRANIGVPGKVYQRFGTSFGTRLIVIDKTGPTPQDSTVTTEATELLGVVRALAEVRNERTHPTLPSESASGESSSPGASQEPESADQGEPGSRDATDGVGAGGGTPLPQGGERTPADGVSGADGTETTTDATGSGAEGAGGESPGRPRSGNAGRTGGRRPSGSSGPATGQRPSQPDEPGSELPATPQPRRDLDKLTGQDAIDAFLDMDPDEIGANLEADPADDAPTPEFTEKLGEVEARVAQLEEQTGIDEADLAEVRRELLSLEESLRTQTGDDATISRLQALRRTLDSSRINAIVGLPNVAVGDVVTYTRGTGAEQTTHTGDVHATDRQELKVSLTVGGARTIHIPVQLVTSVQSGRSDSDPVSPADPPTDTSTGAPTDSEPAFTRRQAANRKLAQDGLRDTHHIVEHKTDNGITLYVIRQKASDSDPAPNESQPDLSLTDESQPASSSDDVIRQISAGEHDITPKGKPAYKTEASAARAMRTKGLSDDHHVVKAPRGAEGFVIRPINHQAVTPRQPNQPATPAANAADIPIDEIPTPAIEGILASLKRTGNRNRTEWSAHLSFAVSNRLEGMGIPEPTGEDIKLIIDRLFEQETGQASATSAGDAAQADAEQSGFGDLEGSTRGLANIFGNDSDGTTETTLSEPDVGHLRRAVTFGLSGVNEGLRGLNKLFGGNRLNSGASFDEDSYRAALPHFKKAFEDVVSSGRSLGDYFAFLRRNFGAKITPYVKRFQADLKSGAVTLYEPLDGGMTIEQTPIENAADTDLTDSVFEDYRPNIQVEGAQPHPGSLVESAAMASVNAPQLTYQPDLPREVITSGAVSLPQIEHTGAAGHAHSQMLPTEEGSIPVRRGYLLGDGTGSGKTHTLAAIMLDNMRRGRKKAIVISQKKGLFNDARDIWSEFFGGNKKDWFRLNNTLLGVPLKRDQNGIMFTTYASLQSGEGTPRSRVNQIVDWVGTDFDGVLIFDESHSAGNARDSKQGRGKKASHSALNMLDLQRQLPNARVVYASATSATEVSNLAYAERLGLWGPGAPFKNVDEFVNEISAAGLPAMEMVARDLKAMGLFGARTLDWRDVKFDRIEHELSAEQEEMYNVVSDAWGVVLRNLEGVYEKVGEEQGSDAGNQVRNQVRNRFFSAMQMFYNQFLTALQMPSVLEQMQNDLDNNRSVLIQVANTNAAQQERQLPNLSEDELQDFNFSPLEIIQDYVQRSFPVDRYQTVIDENGNERVEIVTDSNGVAVKDPEAVAKREEMLDMLGALSGRLPQNPLEEILNRFGVDNVAEMSGRDTRPVFVPDEETGELVRVEQDHKDAAKAADVESFKDGHKRILIFSVNKGGTGFSYHADLRRENQQQRSHYVLQAGWIAAQTMQGLGRGHRSNQASPPLIHLVTTNLPGHQRFISTIARRLAQLGAITQGQRQATGQGLFSERDNLESREARDALVQFITDLHFDRIDGITMDQFQNATGLKIRNNDGNLSSTLPPMSQFLNRLLALRTDSQRAVFAAFNERLDARIEQAIQEETLDAGLQVLKGESIEVAEERTLAADEETGAETSYLRLKRLDKVIPMEWPTLSSRLNELALRGAREGYGQFQGFYQNSKGRVFAVVSALSQTSSGGVTQERVRRIAADGSESLLDKEMITASPNYTQVQGQDSEIWGQAVAALPPTVEHTTHLVTGLLLPHWKKLGTRGGDKQKVFRVQTNDGRRFLGRVIPPQQVKGMLSNFGQTESGQGELSGGDLNLAPSDVVSTLFDNPEASVELANGSRILTGTFQGQQTLEIRKFETGDLNSFRAMGINVERVNSTTRAFIPTDPALAASVVGKLIEANPITKAVHFLADINTDELHAQLSPPSDHPDTAAAPIPQNPRAPRGTPADRLGRRVANLFTQPKPERPASDPEESAGELRPIEFANEFIEDHFQRNKGRRNATTFETVSFVMTTLKNRIVREFEHLPNTGFFAPIRSALLKLEKQGAVSQDKTVRLLKDMLGNLTPREYDIVTRILWLRDIREDIDRGEQGDNDARSRIPDAEDGFTRENVEAALAHVEEAAAESTPIQNALFRRQQIWDAVKQDHIESLQSIGTDVSDKYTREHYFRHQVQDYAKLLGIVVKRTVTGKVQTPSNRSHLKRRKAGFRRIETEDGGGIMVPAVDYNTDLIQAEYEVIAQIIHDIEVARTIRLVQERYDIRPSLELEAAKENDRRLIPIFQTIADRQNAMTQPILAERGPKTPPPATAESVRTQILDKPFAIAISQLQELAAQGTLPDNGSWTELIDAMADVYMTRQNADSDAEATARIPDRFMPQLFAYANWMMGLDRNGPDGADGPVAAARLFSAIQKKRKFIREQLGEEFVTWADLIPEGYDGWQPREGQVFFMAHTIPEQLAEQIADGAMTSLGVDPSKVKRALVMGSKRKEFVIPEPIIETLNNFTKKPELSPILTARRKSTRAMKAWLLNNPKRYIAVQLRNLSGDAEAVFVGNPAAFKKVPQALNELRKVMIQGQDMSPELSAWFERGGMSSVFNEQELNELDRIHGLVMRLSRGQNSLAENITQLPLEAVKTAWKAMRVGSDMRESVLRYAAYLSNLEAINANGGQVTNYQASIRDEIDGMPTTEEKAFHLANDLLGAYDRVGIVGQEARDFWIPFWSFQEINMRRYWRLARNAAHNGELATTLGRKILAKGLSPYTYYKGGTLLIKAATFWAGLQAWNHLMFPDEEEKLPAFVRHRPHLIWGSSADGRHVRVMTRMGMFGDALEWFGLDTPADLVDRWFKGRESVGDLMIEMAQSTPNKLVQGVSPFIKTPVELATQTQLFPNVFDPRPMRDGWLTIFRQLSLDDFYKRIARLPNRPITRLGTDLITPSYDADMGVISDLMTLERRFLKRIGKQRMSFSGSVKTDALRSWRQALRLGDREAANHWLGEYLLRGGTSQGLQTSLRHMLPLEGLSKAEKILFLSELDKDEVALVVRGVEAFVRMLQGPPEETPKRIYGVPTKK